MTSFCLIAIQESWPLCRFSINVSTSTMLLSFPHKGALYWSFARPRSMMRASKRSCFHGQLQKYAHSLLAKLPAPPPKGWLVLAVRWPDSGSYSRIIRRRLILSSDCLFSPQSLPQSRYKAVLYLERRLPGLSNPYAVAMASYALANEGRLNKETLKRFASPGYFFTLYFFT